MSSKIAPVTITVENPSPDAALRAPVCAGIPFARKTLPRTSALSLKDSSGTAVPVQAQCLSRWPDGSCRWVLVDFTASVKAGKSATFVLCAARVSRKPAHPVTVSAAKSRVLFTNGIISFEVKAGASAGLVSSADGEASATISSFVEIGGDSGPITSRVVIDSLDVYARGPLRAAVSLYGRRIYSDGIEGPFSQRVEMFAGSPYVRVEDTFIYAHFPGTHVAPEHPLLVWKVEAAPSAGARAIVAALAADEESEGLVTSENAVAFWGVDKPFEMARWTDEELVGEDTPGIALGVAKSCGLSVGLARKGAKPPGAKPLAGNRPAAGRPLRDLWAHAAPDVYAASGALGDFAPETPGKLPDVEEGCCQILGFWLYFQDHDPKGSFGAGPWHGIFDWGDWQTRYADRSHRPTGWRYLAGRYGWDCNEMDTTLMLWSAFLHSGRPEYWRAAVAMSRHAMDVDVINVDYRKYKLPEYVYDPHHYGAPWKEGQDRMCDMNTVGLGRRHNVQHWGNGVGDTRHTWNGGVIMYYYLTGNRRAYDTALNMADMHMQRMYGYAAGEYALSLWCLNNAWQLTGDSEFLDEFRYRLNVVHKLRLADGSIPEHLDFDNETDYPDVDHGHGAYLDLTLDYISNALIDHYADTADPTAREVLLDLAERNLKDMPRTPADYQRIDALRILAWAYTETKDVRFIERAIYHLSSLAAKPLAKWPSTPDEWLKRTFDLLRPHDWDIRVVGPAVRMAPYVIKAILAAEKG